jgi:hypothetical protein
MATEAQLTAALVRTFREHLPRAVVFKHCDRMTAGIPDVSVTYGGLTVWLEVKLAAPAARSRDQQVRTCANLDRQGACYFVVYCADRPGGRVRTVSVVRASHYAEWLAGDRATSRVGVDHCYVVERVAQLVLNMQSQEEDR